ncbi:MAG: phosphopantetheine-binding protein, partial [Bryobacteraceae bacterium]
EHQILAAAGREALRLNLGLVDVQLAPTPRNQPAQLFLRETLGQVGQFPAERVASLRYQPAAGPRAAAAPVVPSASQDQSIDYARIATRYRDASAVLQCSRGAQNPVARPQADPPRTDLERQLANIWAETMGLAAVGVHEDFFDLGGHSLLAVQLLSRVRQELGVDLSLEVVYGGDFTVAELAKAIEIREIEQVGADRYAALLEELEGLSDEEAARMLAAEGEN